MNDHDSGLPDAELDRLESDPSRLIRLVREREALLKINHAVQAMTRAGDLDGVALACLEGLKQGDINAQAVALHRIVDPEHRIVETYRVKVSGVLASAEQRRSNQLVNVWKAGEAAYLPNKDAVLRANGWTPDDLEAFRRDRFGGLPIQSMVDVPASQVVISVLSTEANVFSPSQLDTIKAIAEVCSLGVARLVDLEQLETHANELVRIERMRALGEIPAGLSHNLNNLLTGVIGPTELLKRSVDDPVALEYADLILHSATRAADLVKQLASATSRSREPLHSIVVLDVVQEAVDAAAPLWKDTSEAKGLRVELSIDIDPEITVMGQQAGLYDIVISLLTNAVDAMPQGGRITIRARADDDVTLSIRDTGIGMSRETMGRVFDPFFTTKMDVGSGLGLSTARGTVRRWGGSIAVESEPSSYTEFTIRLPRWTPPESAPGSGGVQKKHVGRILVVDDDEVVRRVLKDSLSYTLNVETASSGRDALDRFESGRYDVVLIDLGMPVIPGDQVARAMQGIDPSISTVLITGWELPPGDPRLGPFDFKLMKPFPDFHFVEKVIVKAFELKKQRSDAAASASA